MSQDIRDWANENGIELAARGRIPKAVREQYEEDMNGHAGGGQDPILLVPDPGPELPPDGAESDGDGFAAPAPPAPRPAGKPAVAETAPRKPPRERRGLLQRKPAESGKPRKLPRVSTETLLGAGWSILASLAGRSNPALVPMSRMMMFQSATVGIVGDAALKGTVVDRILQPLARAGEKGELAAAIIGPPVIVAVVTARPELYPVAAPVLEALVTTYLEISEPAMAKIQARIERMESKLGGAQVKDLLASVFADVDVPTAPSADEEAAIKRARGGG
jgi:uncharacterized membrane protein YeaQ/YmgE (transglycosylase-associated protein family)